MHQHTIMFNEYSKSMYKIHFLLKSFDLQNLNQTETYLVKLFSFFNLKNFKHQTSRKKYKKITVLRSPHIDKKSREQFQVVRYKKKLTVDQISKNRVLLISEIMKNIKFLGVEIQILIEFSTY